MIYLITNNKENFPDTDTYTLVDMEVLLNYLKYKLEVSIDTETLGFDCHTKDLVSLQLGDVEDQYIVDCKSVDIKCLKDILENLTLIGQNLKFDLKFLYKQGIYPRKVYDTFLVEKILNCGIDHMRAGLDALVERYLDITMDKEIRGSIAKLGLTKEVIQYAAKDIEYLEEIKELQQVKLVSQDLTLVAALEHQFVSVLAYIEYCGFKLDEEKWKVKMQKDSELCDSLLLKLNTWIVDNNHLDHMTDGISTINWNSPKQVLKLFNSIGLDCEETKHGEIKKSVGAKTITKYAASNEIIQTYISYKEAKKVVSTYGESFLKQINKTTGRIHTSFRQILNTGRISSGGKDTEEKAKLINFQNVPTDPETRSCFIANEGNILIISDYSGQEQIILANFSLDKNLLELYDKGFGDMHSYTASNMYPELKDLSLDEIKSKHKDKRQAAKIAGFSINYGGNGSTIAKNQGLSKKDGEAVYDAYFKAFPGLKDYFNTKKSEGLANGYVLISPLTKRKSYFAFYERYQQLASLFTQNYWIKYRQLKEEGGEAFKEERTIVKEYFSYQGTIERASLNFPIQGSGAETIKLASIYIYDYIIAHNLFGKVLYANTIHDEIVIEAPLDIAQDIAKVVKDAMFKSGELFCKRVPLLAEPELSLFWKK